MDRKAGKETEVMLPPVKALRDYVREILREWSKTHSKEVNRRIRAATYMKNTTISQEKRYVEFHEMGEIIRDLVLVTITESIEVRRWLMGIDGMLEALLSMCASLTQDIQRLESTKKDIRGLRSHIRRRYEPIMRQIDAAIKRQREIRRKEKKIKEEAPVPPWRICV